MTVLIFPHGDNGLVSRDIPGSKVRQQKLTVEVGNREESPMFAEDNQNDNVKVRDELYHFNKSSPLLSPHYYVFTSLQFHHFTLVRRLNACHCLCVMGNP